MDPVLGSWYVTFTLAQESKWLPAAPWDSSPWFGGAGDPTADEDGEFKTNDTKTDIDRTPFISSHKQLRLTQLLPQHYISIYVRRQRLEYAIIQNKVHRITNREISSSHCSFMDP